MKKYSIFAGLGGGFGGAHFQFMNEYNCASDAEMDAYNCAVEIYESYAGMYGLRDIDDIIQEDEVDDEAANDIYLEEMEGWLDYYVKEYEEGDEEI